jgi:ppGpp synthetase/RelA/SpoT-type nucleotidyltranferase
VDDLEFARKQWLADEPCFAAFGACVTERLQTFIRSVGIAAQVSARTKEMDSLLKKLIRKPHLTYATMGDRLGARVVVKRLADVNSICAGLGYAFSCGPFENTADRLADDQVGYLSTHVDIALSPADPRIEEFPVAAFRAELQVRTLAQNLWSEMSHDTAYKSGNVVHQGLKRRLHLLAALIEVADNDYQRVEDEIATLPDMPELQVLRALERQYYKLASRHGDTELSLRVIRLLWPLYEKTPAELNVHFETVFAKHKNELEKVFEQAEATASDRSAFLFQPEILMIYDQLGAMPYRLRPQWIQEFPEKELERIAIRFGRSFA